MAPQTVGETDICTRDSWAAMPTLTVIPMQLLTYQITDHRGLDVDHLRNLMKSVTVE